MRSTAILKKLDELQREIKQQKSLLKEEIKLITYLIAFPLHTVDVDADYIDENTKQTSYEKIKKAIAIHSFMPLSSKSQRSAGEMSRSIKRESAGNFDARNDIAKLGMK